MNFKVTDKVRHRVSKAHGEIIDISVKVNEVVIMVLWDNDTKIASAPDSLENINDVLFIPLCDTHRIGLKPNRRYEFYVEKNCSECAAWAAYAAGKGPLPKSGCDHKFIDGRDHGVSGQLCIRCDKTRPWPATA